MFSKPTVFIIGAGGSFELGLPLGNTLKTQVSKAISIDCHMGKAIGGDQLILDSLTKIFAKQPKDFAKCIKAGHDAANGINQALSIDSFIGAHSGDDATVMMGKFGIARCINEAERQSKLMVTGPKSVDFTEVPESWHRVFCQMAFEGMALADVEHVFDNVTIVTFNYDRVIEFYLLESLRAYYKLSKDQAQKIVTKLNVIHVFGKVGKLYSDIQGGGDYVPFGADIGPLQLYNLTGTIQTFTENLDGAMHIEYIRSSLRDAEVVVYLGFSYMKTNLELLSFSEPGRHKQVFGSSLGVFAANRQRIENHVRQSLGGTNVMSVSMEPLGGHEFMQAHWWPILY